MVYEKIRVMTWPGGSRRIRAEQHPERTMMPDCAPSASMLHGGRWHGREWCCFGRSDPFAMPHKANAGRRQHIPRPKRRVTNWAAYDTALRRRSSLTLWFTEAIASWREAPRATSGQLHYSTMAITTALMLRAVFRLALRQTEGLIGSILHLLGPELSVPDHSTIGRRTRTIELPARPRSDDGPLQPLVDSTGLSWAGRGSGCSRSTAPGSGARDEPYISAWTRPAAGSWCR